MYQVLAYQAAKHIDLVKCNKGLKLNYELLFHDSEELFYRVGEDKYIYVFQYGMLCFFNLSEKEIDENFSTLKPYFTDYFEEKLYENFTISVEQGLMEVNFNSVVLPSLDPKLLRITMLYTSQSVALERYSEITENLLNETNSSTIYLEQYGKLNISGKALKRFIGRVLNVKNNILENLYIFDIPELSWEEEELNNLDNALKLNFDLKDRYRRINERIQIIKENLDLFKDILDHSESSKLEWIIIILILVEVIDMFILKFF